jgi:hypothetical protein
MRRGIRRNGAGAPLMPALSPETIPEAVGPHDFFEDWRIVAYQAGDMRWVFIPGLSSRHVDGLTRCTGRYADGFVLYAKRLAPPPPPKQFRGGRMR